MTVTETETALLGAVLADVPGALPVAMARGVRREWFTDDVWAVTWDALAAIWDKGKAESADETVVLNAARRLAAKDSDPTLKDRVSAARFSSAIESAGVAVDAYCLDLKDAYLKKKLRALLNREMKQAEASSADALGVSIRAGLDGLLEEATAGKEIAVREVYGGIMDEYRTAYQKRIIEKNLDWTPGLRMPWVELTRMMNGVRPGLHVLAARPSVGKTSFAVNLMRYWCDVGARVVFCSLDMPRREVLRRFLAERARVSISKAIYSPTQTDLAAMERAMDVQAGLPFSVVETRDVDELKTFCAVRKAAGKLDVAVVDYLQLLHAHALGREDAVEYARISYVSNALKEMANRLELPVIALCQLNRESTKAERAGQMPGLSDLRGSGSIEQDAFTVAILHRDAGTVETWKTPGFEPTGLVPDGTREPAKIVDPIWWILCKSQNGGTGMYPFVSWRPYFSWMIADYNAPANAVERGAGATKTVVADNSPKFKRVHADWRHDPMENVLRANGALLPETPLHEPASAPRAAADYDYDAEDEEQN